MNELNKRLMQAAEKGNAAKVNLLLAVGADAKYGHSLALYIAACNGHTDCVKLLIPVSDPKALNSIALYIAASYGHTDCVKLLIHVSDPKDYARALDGAIRYGHTDCAKLLQEAINERAK